MDKNNIKIIDCFIFYNELELLNYRFNILNRVVDYFVIVESTHTHAGKPKELLFNDNKHLFELFKDKIIHVVVNDFPFKFPNIDVSKGEQWVNENFQRNAISRGLDKIQLSDEDLIIIADLDEIPDIATLYKYKIRYNPIPFGINDLEMDLYYYNLNSKIVDKWYYCKMLSYKSFKELGISCNDIRKSTWNQIIKLGGWHLSYFGDSLFIQNKIQQFAHQEFNNHEFTDVQKIEQRIANSSDLYGRNQQMLFVSIKDNDYLPHAYQTYLRKFFK